MKTIHIVLGLAAIGGVVWYVRNKKSQAESQATPTAVDPAAATGVIPLPKDDSTKVISLPADLLQKPAPSGNTGVAPPSVTPKVSTPVIAPAPKVVSTKIPFVKFTSTLPSTKGSMATQLKGIRDPYILN